MDRIQKIANGIVFSKFVNDRQMLKGIMKEVKKLPKEILKNLDVDFRRDKGEFQILPNDELPDGYKFNSDASSEAMLKYLGWKDFLDKWKKVAASKNITASWVTTKDFAVKIDNPSKEAVLFTVYKASNMKPVDIWVPRSQFEMASYGKTLKIQKWILDKKKIGLIL